MSTTASVLSNPDAVGEWTLTPERSRVGFANKTMWGLMTVRGHFTDVRGHGQITADGAASGQLDIDAATVDTGLPMRDRHLRSPDFLNVDRFPAITVVVTETMTGDGDIVDLDAFITVTGTTTPLTLHSTVDVLDDAAVRVRTEITVDRNKLGVRWNKLHMLGRTVTLSADTVFRRSSMADPQTDDR